MFKKVLMLLFAAKTAMVTCNYESKNLDFEKEKIYVKKIGKLDAVINESSGLCPSPWSKNILTINDSGGKPEIYEINKNGNLISTIPVPNSKNKDWEEITTDDKGNVYIGDFGNNSSQRKDLTVYKFNGENTEKINFEFADQDDKLDYDCEAFFWNNDSLYLFTKSWEKDLKRSRLYVIPDTPGDYSLKAKSEIILKAQITGAAINPSKSEYALIAYGKIFRFGITDNEINFNEPKNCITIAKSQSEAIFYESDSIIIFSNEQRKLFKFKVSLTYD